MSDRFPYNLPSRQALCVEIRKLSKYTAIEDSLVTFEDIYFSPTRTTPGRTFIEMIDLRTGNKAWFTYRRLDLKIALDGNQTIVIEGKITPRTIIEEINRSRNMTFQEDDVDMSDDILNLVDGELIYTIKALSGSYAYYGKVDVMIKSAALPTNVRILENGDARLTESNDYRLLE